MLQVSLINHSTALAADELAKYAAAYQIQANEHYARAHGLVGVDVKVAPKDPGHGWLLGFFDNADQAGALGYHDLTPDGRPLGKVFVKTTLAAGDLVSVTGSHELLEMMGDPLISTCMQISDTAFYAFEVCDACEDDSYGYDINGVIVSDFVTTNWFFQGRTGPYDFRRKITRPQELLPGGYIGVLDLSNNEGWSQLFAKGLAKMRGRSVPHHGSRRERRARGPSNWDASTYVMPK